MSFFEYGPKPGTFAVSDEGVMLSFGTIMEAIIAGETDLAYTVYVTMVTGAEYDPSVAQHMQAGLVVLLSEGRESFLNYLKATAVALGQPV